ncbi:UNVERIFIED_CONTAM: hypothetical protein FKN15_027811, partial [Acipenser sinensis]
CHSRARAVIEQAFGLMKTRWRSIFFKALEVHPTFVPTVISACTILHTVCLSAGDLLEPEADVADDDVDLLPPPGPGLNERSGT